MVQSQNSCNPSFVAEQQAASHHAPAASSAQRHTGYAPADHGGSAAHESCTERHSGYCPTDVEGVRASESHTGGPGGMAATETHSQGGGHVDDGLRHSGWGPTDGVINTRSSAAAAVGDAVVHDV